MATTPLVVVPAITPPVAHEPTALPDPGPLWKFALIGLGPLTGLGIFALLVAAFGQHPA